MPFLPPASEVETPVAAVREDSWGFAASSALHVAAIAALSCVWLPSPTPRIAPAVHTTWTAPLDDQADEPQVIELIRPQSSQSGGRFVPVAAAMQNPLSEPVVKFDQRVPQAVGPMVDNIDLREAVRLTSTTPTTGSGSGTGDGVGGGAGNGSGPDFFPIDQSTGRFVFVVDASKSMNHRYSGPARSRFGRVKVELWRTVYRMLPEQKFFIVFFNTRALPMPATTLRGGGMQNQTDLFNWTATLRADGQTDPQEALLLAMQLQPDVIYFLTDGEFNYKVVREVTKANFGGVTIHTISLGDDAGAEFLQEIAEKNGGLYRHIVEEEDRYWTEELESTAASVSNGSAILVPDGR